MRITVPATAAVLLAACSSNPKLVVSATMPVAVEATLRSDLIGLNAADLGTRFGPPRLQVREGDGLKLQYAAAACVLDAYLYPPVSGGGVARVTHVDTRTRDGRSADQSGCITAIETR